MGLFWKPGGTVQVYITLTNELAPVRKGGMEGVDTPVQAGTVLYFMANYSNQYKQTQYLSSSIKSRM